jgi:hypothetical protein
MSHLEDLFLFRTAVDDLAPLAGLALRRLRIDHPPDGFTLEGVRDQRSLRSLIVRLGDGSVPSLAPLAGLDGLEELAVMGRVEDGDLGPLRRLAGLKRLRLVGDFGGGIGALRSQLPSTAIEIVRGSGPAAGGGSGVEVRALPGSGEWSLFADVSGRLGVTDNLAAEATIRTAIATERPDLVERLEFDSEPERLSIVARSEADGRAAASIVERLIAERRHAAD